MSVLDLQEGTIFAGDYRVIRFLDRGGMGDVYLAEQVSTGQLRALKLMHQDILEKDQSAKVRFEQEARVASKIQSDHIVQVIGAGVVDNTPWLAMELLEGD